ncbi:helix-turn-helix domain-containing protein [Streptosporangium sp. NBC_01755]|uniref:helix-turn-helix domain-containing protein n=1 Tax=Streptosporangium sp. NBC_01755 TaxID=2975949 RepID=UPI002DD9D603|nr:helix-turn-helix domain-containing protein [Streptosporangium sp. NBC_01755]WSD02599.1 helix-turn-helix domain-containing protein [Streptosporangium sp. NBC_01755]
MHHETPSSTPPHLVAEGESSQNAPDFAGVVRPWGKFFNLFSDGTLIPLMTGGSVDIAPELPMLLMVEKTADQLRIGRTRAFVLVKSGEIESIKVDERRRRVPREAIADYIMHLRDQAQA